MTVMQTDSLGALLGGLGDPARDKAAGVYYTDTVLSDEQLLNAYRSTWLARKIVDIPAMDSVRKGRDWQAENEQIEKIEAEEKRLGLWGKVLDARIKARLWGGSVIFIGTGETNLTTPLNPERIQQGGIKYLTVLSRREVAAGELDNDALSETYSRPKDYQVSGATQLAAIHPSRLVIFTGDPFPDPWLAYGPNRGWGDSALQSVMAAVNNANSTAANIASLVFEANVDVFGIPDFTANVADEQFRAAFITRATLAAANKSLNRSILMDASETYDRKQISFATLPDILQQFLLAVAGAADIPATRLLGRSPAGMNATGEHDMKNYHDRLQSTQELELRPAMHRLDECLIRSALGTRPPEVHYAWAPLEQMSEKEQSEISKANAESVSTLHQTGLIPPEVLAKTAMNQMVESGAWPGLEAAYDEWEAANGGEYDLGEVDEDEEEAPPPNEGGEDE